MRQAGAMVVAVVSVFGAVMLTSSVAYAADPCSLLTPEQVATALGVPEVKTSPGATRCGWVPKKYAGGSQQVYLQLENEKFFQTLKGIGVTTPVNGIGDEALLQTTRGTRPVLQVRKGDVVFAVSVTGLSVDAATKAEQTLAKYALSKL
jgi:hypothetical protein